MYLETSVLHYWFIC